MLCKLHALTDKNFNFNSLATYYIRILTALDDSSKFAAGTVTEMDKHIKIKAITLVLVLFLLVRLDE